MGFPGAVSGKESSCHFRRHKRCGFDPWVKKIPWSRKWQPTPVLLPGKNPWTEEPGRLQYYFSKIVKLGILEWFFLETDSKIEI